ncbi:sulfotransferase domain-containing protein [bacterium]|nr:sulfotransferase domain-containing protein [bacterium]
MVVEERANGRYSPANRPLKRTVTRFVRRSIFAFRRTIASDSRFPDFVIIGAQRAGTTSLFNILSGHPSVTQSVVKEVHFFDLNYDKGLEWYKSHFPIYRWVRYGPKHRWGEASPYYLFEPRVPERMHQALPKVKLVVLLRNPIDRAYSDYQRQVQLGQEPLSFEDALAAEGKRTHGEAERMLKNPAYVSIDYQRYAYIERGMYTKQLERWLKLYSRDQMMIIPAERFFLHMPEVLDEVISFLDLPHHSFPGLRTDNSVPYPAMSPVTRDKLRATFADEKKQLEAMTGLTFNWDI